MIEIDHVVWAAADLDEGVTALRQRTGLESTPGGSHPGWGTRNALVGLGETYLEVLATDPAQDGGWLADEVRAVGRPAVSRWALRTDDIDAVAERVRSVGCVMEPASMSRETPDGETIRWRIGFVRGHALGRVVPFVIDWLDTPHPTRSLDEQGRLERIRIGHPDPHAVEVVLAAIGTTTPVMASEMPTLRVTLATPHGSVELGTS